MKPSVYIETSVISYYCGRPSNNIIIAGHQQTTFDWWDNYKQYYDCYISSFVVDEITLGDKDAAKKRLDSIKGLPFLDVVEYTYELADLYYQKLQIPENSKLDAAHLAVAVQHKIDYIVSWNFKHLVNEHVRMKLLDINSKTNLHIPIIITPELLMGKP